VEDYYQAVLGCEKNYKIALENVFVDVLRYFFTKIVSEKKIMRDIFFLELDPFCFKKSVFLYKFRNFRQLF
jgi:hypothetical protein